MSKFEKMYKKTYAHIKKNTLKNKCIKIHYLYIDFMCRVSYNNIVN